MRKNRGEARREAPALRIRPYEPSDWDAVCDLHDKARLQELAASVGTEAFRPLVEVGISEGLFEGAVDVGVIADAVVGFVAHLDDELTWLYVDPAYQGRGYGRALLRHALAKAGPIVRTEVLVGNDVALDLYLGEGFTIVERREGRLSGDGDVPAAGFILIRTRI